MLRFDRTVSEKTEDGWQIFLVDRSEYAQAAKGMTDAHIVGILERHGVGDAITGQRPL
jgi:inorganic pyrophosphatase/exopolyphosphatase